MPPYDRAALRRAMRARNIDRLEAILATIKEQGLNQELSREVREARKLLAILRRMNTIKFSLQEMKQSMLSELVNQASPHNIMMTIMKAVMIVLGVSEEKLEDWSGVQEELGTTPRKNYAFIRRLVCVNPTTVKVPNARRALKIISRFNLDLERVKDISKTLALFYTWLLTLTQEVISIADASSVD